VFAVAFSQAKMADLKTTGANWAKNIVIKKLKPPQEAT